MHLHHAHTEILIVALVAALVLLMSVAFKAPRSMAIEPQFSSQARVPASLQTLSAQTATTGDWVRDDAVQAPSKQTRWVF